MAGNKVIEWPGGFAVGEKVTIVESGYEGMVSALSPNAPVIKGKIQVFVFETGIAQWFRPDELTKEHDISKPAPEMVNHPRHYNLHPAGIECIDVIEHMTFNIGSAIKYAWRAGLKSEDTLMQDLDKAIWYLNREKERLSKGKSK